MWSTGQSLPPSGVRSATESANPQDSESTPGGKTTPRVGVTQDFLNMGYRNRVARLGGYLDGSCWVTNVLVLLRSSWWRGIGVSLPVHLLSSWHPTNAGTSARLLIDGPSHS